MKKALLLFTLLFLTWASVIAQSTQNIKGIVIDSAKNEPMGYVTVALRTVKGKQPVKSTLTKDNGSFEFTSLPGKSYELVLASVGYAQKIISTDSTKKLIDLGRIKLSASSKNLNEVTVTALKPIVKQEVDRIGYDVQADPESKSQTVLEMLRKVPLVSVDAQDNIKLKGNGDFKIFINGKPSALVTKNPSDVLKAMPASNIDKIEVITTPPAKYEAEGLAGIINIITKKNVDQGYNGNISARYNNVWGPGTNLNLTVKQGKFGISGYVGYNKQNRRTSDFENVTNTFHPVVSTLMQSGSNTRQGNNTYGSAELSYELDSLNLITGSIESYGQNSNSDNLQYSNQPSSDPANAQSYTLNNYSKGSYHGTDLALNYQLGFKKSKDQMLTASYKYSGGSSKQDNNAIFSERVNYGQQNYNQYNLSGTHEHTAQIDYVQPLKNQTVEAGIKGIFRSNYSDFTSDVFDPASGSFINNPAQTNNFDYQQNVYSGYGTYQIKLTNWSFKGGARLEHTTIDANFTSVGSAATQDYNNLVPSISIQRKFKSSSLNFGYSDRISRPGIWQLNPFIDQSNPKYINVGNPNLRPALNHSLELNYSISGKGSVNMGLSYAFANNTIQSVTTITPDTVSITTYENVGKSKRLGLNVNVNYPITKKLNISINSQIMRVDLSGTFNNIFYTNSGYQGHTFTYAGYKFDKGYRMGININYDSRYVLLQGKDNNYFGTSLSGSKDFWKDKATIAFYLSNPFSKFRKIDFYSKTDDFEQITANQVFYRAVAVSFTYKFGHLSSDIKKNQRGINNDDSGGGRGGNH
ncbi:TonB-dependent receptor domain-containing protein [Mucilaginibacter sp. KACC 22063]|uniref:TonB-dependent receptor domain-containing protein n=1 Tax=Mucilaginibacter sp. KACC 22063 TaxID=3025666 RepID=UPI002366A524|nr:TonB-dependent receptor [Mucilaginibacter sp. KACC 22063]WDF54846.1 TonB-dependent receptor [Mucilaginibacter sp. KACC 22063]